MKVVLAVTLLVGIAVAAVTITHTSFKHGQTVFGAFNASGSRAEHHKFHECPAPEVQPSIRVAVIGSGSAGSSAAYFLEQARIQLQKSREESGIAGCPQSPIPETLSVTVYERSNRIGGRAAYITPLDNTSYAPVEVGASLISYANYNLRNAAKTFNLSLTQPESLERQSSSLWNGREFILENLDDSKWSQLKLYWRYGLSPQLAINLCVRWLCCSLQCQ